MGSKQENWLDTQFLFILARNVLFLLEMTYSCKGDSSKFYWTVLFYIWLWNSRNASTKVVWKCLVYPLLILNWNVVKEKENKFKATQFFQKIFFTRPLLFHTAWGIDPYFQKKVGCDCFASYAHIAETLVEPMYMYLQTTECECAKKWENITITPQKKIVWCRSERMWWIIEAKDHGVLLDLNSFPFCAMIWATKLITILDNLRIWVKPSVSRCGFVAFRIHSWIPS